MKKALFILLAILLTGILVLYGCGKSTSTPTASQPPSSPTMTSKPSVTTPSQPTASPTPTFPTQPSSTAPAHPGGTLRIVGGSIPKNLGYSPEKAPGDNFLMLPVLEHLAEWGSTSGDLVPVLATSWKADHATNTITWQIREGVKFTDGTPLNAEAVRWNVQFSMDHRTGTGISNIDHLEVTGEYTLVMHMKAFDWQTVQNLGLVQPISPTSYLTAGGTIASGSDEEKSAEWARAHAIGTGAFTVAEWVRDDHITWVKNPNYWRPGMPYLDKVILTAIADPMVASASLQAGEADMWMGGSVNEILILKDKGFKFVQGPGYFNVLLFSDVDPNSPLHDIKVREAVEYALDRPAIAASLGQGLYEPLKQMASSTWPGYVQGYDPRPFNTEKAKQLLAEAGYTNGLTLKILAASGGTTNDVMALFTYYLGLAGITVEPDIADLGRYFGALFGRDKGGWDDICFTASGINPDASDLFVHYGPSPMTFATPNIWKSQAFIDLCNEAIDPKFDSPAAAMPTIQAAVKQAGEDCLFVPLWRSYDASVIWPYVHTEYPKIHGIIWHPEEDWMDPH
jgi:peptide/nickel transport system substrate-binding protein